MSHEITIDVSTVAQAIGRERKICSRLKASTNPNDAALFGLLHRPARKVAVGAGVQTFPAYRMFKQGFTLGEATHRAFAGETKHFDLSSRDLSTAYLEGVASWWQWKIDELYEKNDVEDAFCTAREERARVLDGLQALLDEHVWPLVLALRARPDVERVVLDLY
jgi:hypothetical protein